MREIQIPWENIRLAQTKQSMFSKYALIHVDGFDAEIKVSNVIAKALERYMDDQAFSVARPQA